MHSMWASHIPFLLQWGMVLHHAATTFPPRTIECSCAPLECWNVVIHLCSGSQPLPHLCLQPWWGLLSEICAIYWGKSSLIVAHMFCVCVRVCSKCVNLGSNISFIDYCCRLWKLGLWSKASQHQVVIQYQMILLGTFGFSLVKKMLLFV